MKMKRRQTLQSIGMFALAASLHVQNRCLEGAEDSSPDIDRWLRRMYDNASSLRAGKISGLQWQEVMDRIYADAPLSQLTERLSFSALSKKIIDTIPAEKNELFHRVVLPGSASAVTGGKEPQRVLITKVAHVRKGHSIPPHGHSNMVSAFLCLSGNFAVRQYDRLEDRPHEMIVRQTVDKPSVGAGSWSSISDYRNNVHWLTAQSDDCFLFTSKLIGIESDRPLAGRINIDIHQAVELGSATLKAPKITAQQARERY